MSLILFFGLLQGCFGGVPVTQTEKTTVRVDEEGVVVAATTSTSTTTSTCSITLWMNDPDPKGLNVRAEASSKAKVVGVLPKGTEFTAIGAKEGWIQYEKPIAYAPELGLEWEPLKDGPQTGWVFGGLVATSLRDGWPDGDEAGYFALYPKPDESATPTVRWEHSDPKNPGNESGTIETVLDCKGGWLKVEITDRDKKLHTGWLHQDNQCPSQVTTCP